MKRKSTEAFTKPSSSCDSDDDDFKDLDIQLKKLKELTSNSNSNTTDTDLPTVKAVSVNGNASKSKAKAIKSKSSKAPRRSGRSKIKTVEFEMNNQLNNDNESPCTDSDLNDRASKTMTKPTSLHSEKILSDDPTLKETEDLVTCTVNTSNKFAKSEHNKTRQKSKSRPTQGKKSKKGLALKIPNIISISDESDDEFMSTKKPFCGQIFEIFSPKKCSKTDSELMNYKNIEYSKGSLSDSQKSKSKVLKKGTKGTKSPMKAKKMATTKPEHQDCKTPEKVPKIIDGFCPFCQVPFAALGIQSPNWHSMECMDLPLITSQECENGIKCDSTIPSHYRRFKHTVLANYRASNTSLSVICDAKQSDAKQSDSKQSDAEQSNAKQSNAKHIDAEQSNAKQSDAEQSDAKQSDSKQSDAKQLDLETSVSTSKIEELSEMEDATNCTNIESKKLRLSSQNSGVKLDCDISMDENEKPAINSICSISENNDDEISSCVSIDSNCLNSVGEDNFESYSCDTESDEDIFNIVTPDTPNYFSHNHNIEKNQNIKPIQNIENESQSGGFLFNNNKNCDKTLNVTECAPSVNELSPSNKTAFIDLSSEELNNPTTSANLGISKQTSLFSFFQSKSQKPKDTINKMTYVADDKMLTTKRKSLPALKKVKSDPLGSLKRPLKSASTSNEETKSVKKSSNDTVHTKAVLSSDTDSYLIKNGRRKYSCPFYKKIPETGFTVDAFRYGEIPGCTAYILTHFHYDHYSGLTKKFKQPIYCSQITGNLVEAKLKVESQFINRLPMNKSCMVNGVELILREANHCPGAVIIFMRLPSGRLILHTGDYRAHPTMEEYPELKYNKINDLYLDTTYCNPDYAFPYQQAVIDFAIKIAVKTLADNPRTCIVCGTYTIGKERVFKAVASAIKSKVCVKKDKRSILDCLEDEELNEMITLDPADAIVHVLPMKLLNFNSLSEYLQKHSQFTSILVFEPTGWTHSKKTISLDHVQPKYSRNAITHYGIPYSEHSSFLELKSFVQFLKPTRILPTVNNGNPASRRKMEDLFADWLKETEQDTPTKSKQLSLNQWMG